MKNVELLAQHLIAMADDELLLAHRDSEWTGHAPILEEDIAFGNIALDELGHAASWYRAAAELLGEDPERYPDQLVYERPASEFRNVQLVELPKADWAFTIVRQYLFDAGEMVRLDALSRSSNDRVAELAAKIRTEELYHQRHMRAWVKRLGLGTEESGERMQRALDELFPYSLQLFVPQPSEAQLVEQGVLPDSSAIEVEWQTEINAHIGQSGLNIPPAASPPSRDRSQHTEHLRQLVDDLQALTRQHAGARW